MSDGALTTTHVGVCTALAVAWADSGFINPFNISRSRVMIASKIKSAATYHKIVRDLIELEYIKYSPSYHPERGSEISMCENK